MNPQRPFFPACGLLASTLLFFLTTGCATAPAENSPVAGGDSGLLADLAANAYEPGALDRQPRPLVQRRPAFPAHLRRAGISGEVVVEFIIDRDGNVRQAQAVGATNEELARAAVEAVAEWKFSPGIKDGHPVDTVMRMPMAFSLGQ